MRMSRINKNSNATTCNSILDWSASATTSVFVLGTMLQGLHVTWTSARVSTEPSTSTRQGPLLQRGVTTFVSCF